MLVNAELKDEECLWISPGRFMHRQSSGDDLELFAGDDLELFARTEVCSVRKGRTGTVTDSSLQHQPSSDE